MIFSEIKKTIKYRFNLSEDRADELEIVESLKKGVEFKGVNLWTLIFAIFIASIGLNINSTAVIIGAMLISPLMGPIMGIGLGAAILDTNLLRKAIKNLLFAILIAIATSCLYFWISPLNEAKSELLARTNPTIWDLMIALFGGLTGIIAGLRKNAGNAVPGVAIATALMPPLCTVGYGLSIGNFSFVFGAFYLFLINSFFICLSTYWIIKLLQFKKVDELATPISLLIKRVIYTSSFILIVPSLYFGYTLVKQELFIKNVNEFLAKELISDSVYVITKSIDPIHENVKIVLLGNELDNRELQKIKSKKNNYNLIDADIEITSSKSTNPVTNQDYSTIINELFTATKINSIRKDSLIDVLTKQLQKSKNLTINEKAISKEYTTLFGKTKSFSINKSLIFDPTFQVKDTITILYATISQKPTNEMVKKIESWLKVRVGCNKVKVFLAENEH